MAFVFILKDKAVYDIVAALFLLPHKKALLSISDGRASSFFNTFIKIITPPPFLQAADFRVQRYEEKPRNLEKIREKRRKSEKIRENQRKSEKNQRKFRENQRKIRENTEKFREKWRKMEKNVEKRRIICKFLVYL